MWKRRLALGQWLARFKQQQIGFADPLSLCFLVLDLDLMWFLASVFASVPFLPSSIVLGGAARVAGDRDPPELPEAREEVVTGKDI